MRSSENLTAGGRRLRLDLVRRGLQCSRLGRRFHYFEEVASTNAVARELAEKGAAEGEVVVADGQTAGRGRLGRPWVSPAFVNLYFSIILRPRLPSVRAPQLTFTAAVAAAEAAATFTANFAAIKWPNDIMIEGKKLGGILTELSGDVTGMDYAILGIGVNVNYPLAAMPPEIRGRATSLLALTGKRVSRESLLRRLIQDLDRCYAELESEGFGSLAARWESRFTLRGRRVRVELLDQRIEGRAKGIDWDGALLIEVGGKVERVLAGEVIPVND